MPTSRCPSVNLPSPPPITVPALRASPGGGAPAARRPRPGGRAAPTSSSVSAPGDSVVPGQGPGRSSSGSGGVLGDHDGASAARSPPMPPARVRAPG